MFLVAKKGVVLVDAPPALGEQLSAAVAEVTAKPVAHVIHSHAHSRHIGAAHQLNRDGLKIILHEITARFIHPAQRHHHPGGPHVAEPVRRDPRRGARCSGSTPTRAVWWPVPGPTSCCTASSGTTRAFRCAIREQRC
ncbi:MBL fold metallo-hydrolase [Streptomyces sp. NBC_01615]|uniref:MBL fold metallo-hydrolase n=1 Tax=Streptomyces sp. NBC_01615 TaxID=2975898 RepID=UPI003869C51D